jgi:hypothetical protein
MKKLMNPAQETELDLTEIMNDTETPRAQWDSCR